MLDQNTYHVIGLMSGTSLDGVDLAYCSFNRKGSHWRYGIHHASTVAYNRTWKKILQAAHHLPGQELIQLNVLYGHYLGNLCNEFCKNHAIHKVDFISSHGHTVYHQPGKGFTFQIGDGNAIHNATGKNVVCDFRSLDVMRGGEGAPLVPVGDHILFGEYDVCLNLGGIANCSMQQRNKRVAFDICFANMALNYLAEQEGKRYDKDGQRASTGTIDKRLFRKLQAVSSKNRRSRPSLSREIFETQLKPLLDQTTISIPDALATVTESVAVEISRNICGGTKKTVLCTGGGAYNAFLMYRLLEHAGDRVSLVIPEPSLVKFKEAVVFGFLGVLRVRNEINCLKSVTGAQRDSSTGVLIGF